jgi:hypothetical protein
MSTSAPAAKPRPGLGDYKKLPGDSPVRQALEAAMKSQGQTSQAKRPTIMEGKKPEKSGGDATIGSSGKSLGN